MTSTGCATSESCRRALALQRLAAGLRRQRRFTGRNKCVPPARERCRPDAQADRDGIDISPSQPPQPGAAAAASCGCSAPDSGVPAFVLVSIGRLCGRIVRLQDVPLNRGTEERERVRNEGPYQRRRYRSQRYWPIRKFSARKSIDCSADQVQRISRRLPYSNVVWCSTV